MIHISRFDQEGAERLFPLFDVWVSAHRDLPLRPDYRQSFARWIDDMKEKDKAAVFVVRDDSEMVGMVIGSIMKNGPLLLPDEFGYMNILVVLPGYRRQGLARRLWKTFETWCRESGVEELHLYTLISNEQARRFWKGQNFETHFEVRVHLPENQSGPLQGKDTRLL